MSRPTRRKGLLVAVFVLVVAVLLLGFRRDAPPDGAADATGHGSDRGVSSFTISGDVRRAVVPGELVAIDLRLDNTSGVDLEISHFTVALVSVDAPRAVAGNTCSAADFEVRQLSAGVVLIIAGNSASNLSGMEVPEESWPAVGMLDRQVNQDGCKGASLTLRYEASGVEVPR